MNPQPEHLSLSQAVWAFVVAHQTEIKEAGSGVLAFSLRHFWPQVKALLKKDVQAEESKVVLALNHANPMVRSLGLALDAEIEKAIPGAGDARYTAAAALLLHDSPSLAWAQPEVVSLLTQLCLAGKTAASEVRAQAQVKEAVPGSPAA